MSNIHQHSFLLEKQELIYFAVALGACLHNMLNFRASLAVVLSMLLQDINFFLSSIYSEQRIKREIHLQWHHHSENISCRLFSYFGSTPFLLLMAGHPSEMSNH